MSLAAALLLGFVGSGLALAPMAWDAVRPLPLRAEPYLLVACLTANVAGWIVALVCLAE